MPFHRYLALKAVKAIGLVLVVATFTAAIYASMHDPFIEALLTCPSEKWSEGCSR